MNFSKRVLFLHAMTFIVIYIFHYYRGSKSHGFAEPGNNKSNLGIRYVTEGNIRDVILEDEPWLTWRSPRLPGRAWASGTGSKASCSRSCGCCSKRSADIAAGLRAVLPHRFRPCYSHGLSDTGSSAIRSRPCQIPLKQHTSLIILRTSAENRCIWWNMQKCVSSESLD